LDYFFFQLKQITSAVQGNIAQKPLYQGSGWEGDDKQRNQNHIVFNPFQEQGRFWGSGEQRLEVCK